MTPAASPEPVALVAGGSRGLGLLIARELGRRGHRLVICARDAVELERAADDLRELGYPVRTEICDVADQAAVEQLVDRVETAEGPIEVLVTVAGVIQVGPLDAMDRGHFTSAVDIMLWGPINTTLAVTARMRQRKRGRVGVITSIGGLVAAPHLLPYVTAKFGAVGFSRGLRTELAGSGVSVTTVAPGLMRTGSHLRAQFVGQQSKEYAWFSALANIPVVSMDAERAARTIVDRLLAGRAMVVLTPLAKIGWRVDTLFPNLTAALLGIAVRLLPGAKRAKSGEALEGWQAAQRLSQPARRASNAITTLGARAADRFNENP
jgi:short-subunit dehydrogenase